MCCQYLKRLTLYKIKKKLIFLIIASALTITSQGQNSQLEVVGPWEHVSGFSISQNNDYIVLSVTYLGINQLFESHLENGEWSDLQPIETINKHHGPGFEIEGPTLNFNSEMLFYHANFPDSKGGFDIYYSLRGPDGWGAPVNIGSPINTPENEVYPSISPGQERLFFARSTPDVDFKKPRNTPDCQKIFVSTKNLNDEWEYPIQLHDLINRGCEYSPKVAIDGRTLVFASVDADNHRDGYNIYFTREIMEDNWLDATPLNDISSEETNLDPQIAGDYLYFIRKTSQRREEFSKIYRVEIPSPLIPLKTITSRGRIVTLKDQKPIDAKLTVFDPTTLKKLGEFHSNSQTGEYEMPLLDRRNYIVDVRRHGYSFFSFMVDLREEEKRIGPELIELFDEIELNLSVYDNENFRPIDVEVFVENASDSDIKYSGKKVSEGIYTVSLPIGSDYVVSTNSLGFEDDQFDFDLNKDVIFSRFERNLALTPIRKAFEIVISDSETDEGIAAEVLITNLSREEVIIFSAEDVKDGKVTAMLREGDEYEFTVRGAQGYSFHNQVVNMAEEETGTLKAELVSLKAEASIRLNNINFSTNSAELSSESFPELNRVVQLIDDNPSIIIEISAHTDNVGSASFNQLLSERRAQSVVGYLLDNGVTVERLIAKGYGLANPMVPNTSDENRALNRRVEFKIVDIIEDEIIKDEQDL